MTIWRMHIACSIPKARNTHSKYIILIDFPLQQWLHERATALRYKYIHWLSCNTGLFEMIVGVLTTCHTQYTWDSSICIFIFNRTTFQVFVTYLTGALYVHLLWFLRVIRNDCRGFNNLPCIIHFKLDYMYFLFNITTLQIFVTYLTGALYVHPFVILQVYSKWLSGF